MPKRNTFQEVEKYIESFGYKLLSKEYINNKTKLKMLCPNKHIIDIRFDHFKQGTRCSHCANNFRLTIEYIRTEVEKEGYKLISEKYVNNHTPLVMKCPKGHITNTIIWNNFKNGSRCPICNSSKGEMHIEKFLINKKINYMKQYKFDDCKCKRMLPFDFYLPEYNCCIEYDGKQHYLYGCFDINLLELMNIKYRDNIKNDYCNKNNIKLIRIPYWEFDNIEEILEFRIKK